MVATMHRFDPISQVVERPMIFTAHENGQFDLAGRRVTCVLGRGGVKPALDKREGDGATPLGTWPIRRLLYRPDRTPPPRTGLPVHAIQPHEGWCDAPEDPFYNRPVRLPYPASAEALWRQDRVYDLICVLGHNDDPPVAHLGSAIFLHLVQPDRRPTEGCVALALDDMLSLLALARPGDSLAIVANKEA
jgi:L,D-peptidoglycan transpeptidase YkuD (ErfK/YbiS/YcfS/YnhG family)